MINGLLTVGPSGVVAEVMVERRSELAGRLSLVVVQPTAMGPEPKLR